MVNKEDEASDALKWLRGGVDVNQEFINIKENVDEDMKNKGSWKELFNTKKNRMSFIIVQITCAIRYSSGMTSIVLYITQTFAESNSFILGINEMTILFAFILVLTTFGASFLADSVGRKPLLIISSAGATIFHTIIAIYYYLDAETNIDVSQYMWIPYVSLISYGVITNVGLGPLMMTIQAEYFPSNTRAIGGGITGVVGALVCFLNVKLYQVVVDYVGNYMNYVLFAVISAIGTVIFSLVIHETAGKSLGEVQKTFENTANSNKHINEHVQSSKF